MSRFAQILATLCLFASSCAAGSTSSTLPSGQLQLARATRSGVTFDTSGSDTSLEFVSPSSLLIRSHGCGTTLDFKIERDVLVGGDYGGAAIECERAGPDWEPELETMILSRSPLISSTSQSVTLTSSDWTVTFDQTANNELAGLEVSDTRYLGSSSSDAGLDAGLVSLSFVGDGLVEVDVAGCKVFAGVASVLQVRAQPRECSELTDSQEVLLDFLTQIPAVDVSVDRIRLDNGEVWLELEPV